MPRQPSKKRPPTHRRRKTPPAYPIPANEAARLSVLYAHQILDTPPEREFDDLTQLAAHICGTPMSLISLLDADRQWFKSRVGVEIDGSPRNVSFCTHAVMHPTTFVVPDAAVDPRFAHSALVTGHPNIRFYAGAPLLTEAGEALGTLCVMDRVPRELTPAQIEALQILSRQVMSQMRLRSSVAKMAVTLERLSDSERFARSTVDALSAQMAILDEHGTILAVNEAWRNFATANGSKTGEFFEGSNYFHVCERATGPCSQESAVVAAGLRSVIDHTRQVFELEYPCHSPTEERWFVVRASRFSGKGPTRVVVAHEDVTVRRKAQDRLLHDSLHDSLTGLPNRAHFNQRVRQCLEHSRRDPNYHFAVLFLDLDRFKVVNDSLGHAAGDLLLTTVARRLRECLRATDDLSRTDTTSQLQHSPADDSLSTGLPVHGPGASTSSTDTLGGVVARLGGDEFTMLLDGLRRPEDAARVAERILASVCTPFHFGSHELAVTASIGIVVGQPDYNCEKDVLRDADAAMYKAKDSGKNKFAIFDDTLHFAAVSRLRQESDLRRALERDELLLHYQPIVSLSTRHLVGFEALIRWQHGGKLISPADFVPIAEETGLIVPIGAWVLRTACAQLAEWQHRFPGHADLSMSINLSRRQFTDPSLVPTLQDALASTGVNPAQIKLEITESIIMSDARSTQTVLAALKATGIRLSMDDFGTGYSSLSCLHRFPLDELKVDRSFVTELEGRRDAAAVLSAVVHLAHNLNLRVVAEGVERMEQVAFLQTVDCDYAQGYLFARPQPAEAIGQYLTTSLVRAA